MSTPRPGAVEGLASALSPDCRLGLWTVSGGSPEPGLINILQHWALLHTGFGTLAGQYEGGTLGQYGQYKGGTLLQCG